MDGGKEQWRVREGRGSETRLFRVKWEGEREKQRNGWERREEKQRELEGKREDGKEERLMGKRKDKKIKKGQRRREV